MTAQTNWRKARRPVTADELTAGMLANARRDADSSRLAQTVWPSRFYGKDFEGEDALTYNACALFAAWELAPAVPDGATPLVTVLPSQWFGSQC